MAKRFDSATGGLVDSVVAGLGNNVSTGIQNIGSGQMQASPSILFLVALFKILQVTPSTRVKTIFSVSWGLHLATPRRVRSSMLSPHKSLQRASTRRSISSVRRFLTPFLEVAGQTSPLLVWEHKQRGQRSAFLTPLPRNWKRRTMAEVPTLSVISHSRWSQQMLEHKRRSLHSLRQLWT